MMIQKPKVGGAVTGTGAGIDAPVDDGNEMSSVTGGFQPNTVPVLSEIARIEGEVFIKVMLTTKH